MGESSYLDLCRQIYNLQTDLERLAKRRGNYVEAQQVHRSRLQMSAIIARQEREERRDDLLQLTLLPGRSGRRHDDGDAA